MKRLLLICLAIGLLGLLLYKPAEDFYLQHKPLHKGFNVIAKELDLSGKQAYLLKDGNVLFLNQYERSPDRKAVLFISSERAFKKVNIPGNATLKLLKNGHVQLGEYEIVSPNSGEIYAIKPLRVYIDGREDFFSDPAVLLSNGRILGFGTKHINLFNLKGNEYSILQKTDDPYFYQAVLLKNGNVLIAKQNIADLKKDACSVEFEIFETKTQSFKDLVTSDIFRSCRAFKLTALPDGMAVLSQGGPIEIFNPETNKNEKIMNTPFDGGAQMVTVVLTDGKVFLAGGSGLKNTGIFEPKTYVLRRIEDMPIELIDARGILLQDNSILIYAGFAPGFMDDYSNRTVFLYKP